MLAAMVVIAPSFAASSPSLNDRFTALMPLCLLSVNNRRKRSLAFSSFVLLLSLLLLLLLLLLLSSSILFSSNILANFVSGSEDAFSRSNFNRSLNVLNAFSKSATNSISFCFSLASRDGLYFGAIMCEDDDDEKDDEGIIAVTDEPSFLAFPLTAVEPLFTALLFFFTPFFEEDDEDAVASEIPPPLLTTRLRTFACCTPAGGEVAAVVAVVISSSPSSSESSSLRISLPSSSTSSM
mmetsp:Transcript_9106/g.29328  ORF Transcript_9106/g.29328 Transcript_9106/m.29328 type:complete len:238 (+) Transcript_9106:2437-3150(+)